MLYERWTSDDQLHAMAASPVKNEYGGGTWYTYAAADCQANSARRWWRVELFTTYSTRFGTQKAVAETSVYGCLD